MAVVLNIVLVLNIDELKFRLLAYNESSGGIDSSIPQWDPARNDCPWPLRYRMGSQALK